uniref:CASPASE_P20 domain-containing protein n=1 Tax=Macrostomum lignano TaxID=282301 RepID=A0A1I8G5N2_9PLAT
FKKYLEDCDFQLKECNNIDECTNLLTAEKSVKLQAVLVVHSDSSELDDQLKALFEAFDSGENGQLERLLIVCGNKDLKEKLRDKKNQQAILLNVNFLCTSKKDEEDTDEKYENLFKNENNEQPSEDSRPSHVVVILAEKTEVEKANTLLTKISQGSCFSNSHRLVVVHLRERLDVITMDDRTAGEVTDSASDGPTPDLHFHKQSGLIIVRSESTPADACSLLGSRFVLALCSAIYFGAGNTDVASMICPINSIVKNGFSNKLCANFADQNVENNLLLPYWIVQTTDEFFLDEDNAFEPSTTALILAKQMEKKVDGLRIALEANGWKVHAEYGDFQTAPDDTSKFTVVIASYELASDSTFEKDDKLGVWIKTDSEQRKEKIIELLNKFDKSETVTLCSCAVGSEGFDCTCKKCKDSASHEPLICVNCKECVRCRDKPKSSSKKVCKKCGLAKFYRAITVDPATVDPEIPVPECSSSEETKSSSEALWKLTQPDEKQSYSTPDPSTRVLIINNLIFGRHGNRLGSEKDTQRLLKVFTELGFKVSIRTNLTGKQIHDLELKDDVAILVLMTHGIVGYLYGCDDDDAKEKDILQKFAGKRTDKPKLLIFQVCRNYSDGVSDEKNEREPLPEYEDVIVAHSTVPLETSAREGSKGSRFITSLCSVFQQFGKEEDVVSMIERVNYEMAHKNSADKRQVSSWLVRMDKKFFLAPEPIAAAEPGKEKEKKA